MTSRLVVGPQTIPALARHVKLRFDEARGAWVLLAPERIMVPDEVALAILQRLDGRASISRIAQALARDYEAGPDEIADDIIAMLQDLADKGYVTA